MELLRRVFSETHYFPEVVLIDKLTIVELLLTGVFGLVCFSDRSPRRADGKTMFRSSFQRSGRLERLRRSRWQYMAIVAVMLVLRIQHTLPPTVELTVGLLFLVMLAFPIRYAVRARK